MIGSWIPETWGSMTYGDRNAVCDGGPSWDAQGEAVDVQRLEHVDAELCVYLPLMSRRSLQGETDGVGDGEPLGVVGGAARSGGDGFETPAGLVDAASLSNAHAWSPLTVRPG